MIRPTRGIGLRSGNRIGKIPDILYGIPVLLLIPFLFGILAVSFFKRAEFCGYRFGDNPVWTKQDTVLLIASVTAMLGAFILVHRIAARLDRFGKRVAPLILYVSLIIQVFFILFLPAKQFADQNAVNQIALDMIRGKFTAFQKRGYLYQYPNNIGITMLLSVVYRVFPNTMLAPKLLNVVFSSLTTYLIFRIYEETHRPEKTGRYGILILAGFFPPMIMLNNLVYNDIIATTFFTGMVLETVMYVKSKKPHHLLLAGIFTAAGNFLRQVGIILLIAATLYLVISKTDIIKALAFFLLVFMLCRLPMPIVNHFLLGSGKITEPIGMNSIPIHMWINMGMNEKKFGYWDNSQSLNIYLRQGGWDKEKSAEIYTSMIMNTIRENGLPRIARVYLKKDAWLWTEGTYQAEYYGIGSWGYLYPTHLTRLLQDDWMTRDSVRWFLHSMNFLLLALSCAGLVSSARSKSRYPLILPAIVMIGFIIFYTIWEIKPRYIYLTYPYLILMAYDGLEYVSNGVSGLLGRLSGHGRIS